MPGLEVHPANGEGGGVDAGREVVQIIEDTSCYRLRRNVKNISFMCTQNYSSSYRRCKCARDGVGQPLDALLLIVEDEHVLVDDELVVAARKR